MRSCVIGSRSSRPRNGSRSMARDAEIERRFRGTYDELASGVPQSWLTEPEGYLAAILVLDQFPRNMFRGTPRAFATDGASLTLAKRAIAGGKDMLVPPERRAFIYMPFICRSSTPRTKPIRRARSSCSPRSATSSISTSPSDIRRSLTASAASRTGTKSSAVNRPGRNWRLAAARLLVLTAAHCTGMTASFSRR